MDTMQILGIVIFAGVLVIACLTPLLNKIKEKKEAKEKETRQKWELEEQKRNKEEIFNQLAFLAKEVFGVDLHLIHESGTQDEIVRIVNLRGHEAAQACVNQDKTNRGENIKLYIRPKDRDEYLHPEQFTWDEMAHEFKIAWSEKRNLAIQIAPELTNRMPHFSEFEPLKSYNAEYLLQKKAKSIS